MIIVEEVVESKENVMQQQQQMCEKKSGRFAAGVRCHVFLLDMYNHSND